MMAVSVSCRTLRDFGEAQVTAILNDRVSRAFLMEGDVREIALDANARLFTELRERHVWPARFQLDQVGEQDDGA